MLLTSTARRTRSAGASPASGAEVPTWKRAWRRSCQGNWAV